VVPLVMTIAVEMAGLAELSRTHGSGIGLRDQVRLVWSVGPYWLLSAVAAVRALVAAGGRPANVARDGDHDVDDEADHDGFGNVAGKGVIDLSAGETGAGVAADVRAIAALTAGGGSGPKRRSLWDDDGDPATRPEPSTRRTGGTGSTGSAEGTDDAGGAEAPTWPTGWTEDARRADAPPGGSGASPASAMGPGVIPVGDRPPVWVDVSQPELTRAVPDR
jgi:hypothetical protein